MSRLFAGFPRKRSRAIYAVAAILLAAFLALLFAFPAPKPYIDAQIELRGWNRQQGVAVKASEERGISLEWETEDKALLKIVAPRDALITVSSEEGATSFTIHELIIYTEQEWTTARGAVSAKILGGKVVDWRPSLVQEAYVALYDNRFVLALLSAFSLTYLYVRSRDRFRRLAPLLIVCCLLVYQVLFFLDLTPTLYWDTPLSDPFVRACLVTQMVLSLALIVLWFPLRALVGRVKPDLLERADGFIDRYGLLLLVAVPILQHLLGNGVFGYNLQPTDGRYTYMDWGRTMLERGFLSFFAKGLVRGLETPLVAAVWALFYGATRNGYVASAVVPMLYFELAIVGTYLLARELFDRRVAFCAGLFLSLSPLFSFASYFVVIDVPSAAMTVLTLWVFTLALKRKSMLLAVASGACLFLTVMTKLTALYCAFLMVVLYVVVGTRRKGILLASLAFVVLVPLAIITPYFLQHGLSVQALQAAGQDLAGWAKRPMFQIRDSEPADWQDMILESGQTHYYMGPVPKLFYFRYLVNGVGFPIVFWGVLVLVLAIEQRLTGHTDAGALRGDRARLWALVVWILPLLAFLTLWSMKNTRFSYGAFPAYAMLGACGFILFKGDRRFEYVRHSGLLLGISVIMLSTQSAAHYYNVSYLKNADYRDPIFIESSEPYYYIHRYYSGWHVGWNGAGNDHAFSGSIETDGHFVQVEPFELETYPDVLKVTDSDRRIEFDTMSRRGEDGCDFVIEGGTSVTFDLLIDGASYPDHVYVYIGSIGIQREVASTLPLTLQLH
jgi:4-amino-4-deoxy-L-arabinose transferase-like glycosyltransferase